MDDDKPGAKGNSEFEKAGAKNASLGGEILGFLGQNKKWWLLPIMLVFLFFGAVVLFGGTAAAPFIYTFF